MEVNIYANENDELLDISIYKLSSPYHSYILSIKELNVYNQGTLTFYLSEAQLINLKNQIISAYENLRRSSNG